MQATVIKSKGLGADRDRGEGIVKENNLVEGGKEDKIGWGALIKEHYICV